MTSQTFLQETVAHCLMVAFSFRNKKRRQSATQQKTASRWAHSVVLSSRTRVDSSLRRHVHLGLDSRPRKYKLPVCRYPAFRKSRCRNIPFAVILVTRPCSLFANNTDILPWHLILTRLMFSLLERALLARLSGSF